MKRLAFLLLCAVPVLLSCQRSTTRSATPKPDGGNFAQNTYRNEFFGFSYSLPKEWHKSRVSPSPLPSGDYYLFIGDRNTGHPLLNRVMVVAVPDDKRTGPAPQDFVSAFIRAQVRDFHAEVIGQGSSFSAGGADFYRTDYKWVNDGTTIYSSFVCAKRNGYWLSWNFLTPSQKDLDDDAITLQNIAFDHPSVPSR